MINAVILVGRLTKAPELRYTPNGVAVATFTVAVNRPFTNQNGDQQADFINVVVWRNSAESSAKLRQLTTKARMDYRIRILLQIAANPSTFAMTIFLSDPMKLGSEMRCI